MISSIPYGRQDISQQDIDSVVDVLHSDYLTQGPALPAFEKAIANYCNAEHAIALSSATAALHLACLALDLGPGDLLWTSPITFVASANCAIYCGASVDFVDINPHTYNMDVEKLSEKLVAAEKVGKLPKIVMPVHLAGQSCEMTAIHTLSKKYGFRIIEDASHAIGGKYKGDPVGNCRYSDITIFSFHPVKIITTGEGGLITTNDSKLSKRLQRLRSHGITSDQDEMQSRPSDEIWNYQQITLGYNYRMTDIHAALGLSQLTRLNQFVKERQRIAQLYDNELKNLPVVTPWQNPDTYSSYHLYPIRINVKATHKSQREVYDRFQEAGINVNLHYIPVYRQPYYESMGFQIGYCEEAEKYFKSAISIPVFSSLTNDQQSKVIEVLKSIFN
ncbi:MAG: UDP-4-amino-4,6-dideoxy-N-acetyl-beta-L-altrosamine transaminase [Daejeonella sp.]|uniref:UDP-4-amino-4, 6-dideoxy-N-acetyl-beta-L-altrosamine transaminase n=1 Tax=Daejeonella sp. TaxID=2805397 RepID=UPI00273473D3|nr:UDP-4-amino-4,6-dideoxy-N-acetyl-beta-L-altrosamine transaminase [Daejeonella sp.]MDP3467537.1 UDP-4-amino-4,6-dideoxy-N-acetyl-beta-L-altrosamine transaminase [Daejeonella sp.]